MGSLLTALVGTFGVGTLVGWFVHWLMHQNWTGRLYRSHMTHHLKLYPPKDLLSETYRDAGSDNGAYVFTGAITTIILLGGIVAFLLGVSLVTLGAVAIYSIVVGFLHDRLHTAFHLRGTWLERFKWFQGLRALHFYHHRKMNRNLGIFWFGWDRLMRVFRDPGAVRSGSPRRSSSEG